MKKFSDFTPKRYNRLNEDLNNDVDIDKKDETGDKIEDKIVDSGAVTPSNFFSKLFESRQMVHVYHLQVKGDEGSNAKHLALQNYYENIEGLIDDLIEIYQGQYELIEDYDVIDTKETKTKEPLAYYNELATYIKDNRVCISSDDTHLHNIIDEVLALVYKTIYKLKYTL